MVQIEVPGGGVFSDEFGEWKKGSAGVEGGPSEMVVGVEEDGGWDSKGTGHVGRGVADAEDVVDAGDLGGESIEIPQLIDGSRGHNLLVSELFELCNACFGFLVLEGDVGGWSVLDPTGPAAEGGQVFLWVCGVPRKTDSGEIALRVAGLKLCSQKVVGDKRTKGAGDGFMVRDEELSQSLVGGEEIGSPGGHGSGRENGDLGETATEQGNEASFD
ncbi:MAG: hypothetical protein RLZZ399_2931 [Verrucomicrobiota bacterium]